MENFEVFDNENLGSVRVVYLNGEPWFVAKDVCDCLLVNNPRQALTRLDDDEKNTVILNDGNRGNPNFSVISESGLYALIMSSRKKEARDFQKWVTREVLPSIRKNGGYILGQEALKETEREELIAQIKKLSKEASDWKADSDYWMDLYFSAINKADKTASEKQVESENAKSSISSTLVTTDGFIYSKELWEVLNAAN